MKIQVERLMSDLTELSQFGRTGLREVTRPALTPADLAARAWLSARMTEAGLAVRTDPALNQIGRLDCGRLSAPSVVIGSHLDSVPQGGVLDGALGVLAGLECARTIKASGIALPWHLEVINFTDEEGYRNAGTVGSRAMMGLVGDEELRRSKMPDRPPLIQILAELGHDPSQVPHARRQPGEIRAYLELHVEQGSRLEAQGADIGVVTEIVGIYRYAITIAGRADHASMPMRGRVDALVSAAPLFLWLPQWAMARSLSMVATVGQLVLEPGATNIVPGKARFVVELRSLDPADMAQVRALVSEYVGARPGSSMETVLEKGSVRLDDCLQSLVTRAASAEGATAVSLPSGAGHDAQSFAPYVPAAMVFVPSKGGRSHCAEEWTEPTQLQLGAQVLLRSLCLLAALDSGEEAGTCFGG